MQKCAEDLTSGTHTQARENKTAWRVEMPLTGEHRGGPCTRGPHTATTRRKTGRSRHVHPSRAAVAGTGRGAPTGKAAAGDLYGQKPAQEADSWL